MNWKHRKVKQLSGGSLSGNLVEVAKAVNYNAEVLREAVQKIEELSIEVEKVEADGRVRG